MIWGKNHLFLVQHPSQEKLHLPPLDLSQGPSGIWRPVKFVVVVAMIRISLVLSFPGKYHLGNPPVFCYVGGHL